MAKAANNDRHVAATAKNDRPCALVKFSYSHKSDLHKPGSENQQNRDKNKRFQCRDCERVTRGFNAYLQHCYVQNDYRGHQDVRKNDEIQVIVTPVQPISEPFHLEVSTWKGSKSIHIKSQMINKSTDIFRSLVSKL
ncbi:hypothetical protein HD806DRAFT_521537 [Xylariaceae sp. AK1471]|nr:hypothetical protein HD806DRAFT_521537 [Xylariaceae sp. AK1471]